MRTFIVADEIHFQGYRVAILTRDAPATVIEDFEDGINDGTLFNEDKYECSECNEKAEIHHLQDCSQYKPSEQDDKDREEFAYDCCLDDVQGAAKEYARGGLLTLTDLAKLCKELKESKE